MIAANRRSGGRKHFRREYDKKVQVLGLLTVLALPDAALPPELAAGLDRLLGGTTALLAALKDQQACGLSVLVSHTGPQAEQGSMMLRSRL